jgi:peptidoglycan/LPS O-acetylase OafA/YrhL
VVEVAVGVERGRVREQFEGFDGMRAIAALSVALTHATFVSGVNATSDFWGPYTARLDIGVAVFFLISGFLLYRPFAVVHLTDGARVDVRSYLGRRFLRIFPAFWVTFTLVAFLLPRPHRSIPSIGGLVAHYSLTHVYFRDHVVGPVQQSWTLATEIAFYVFLPLYAVVLVGLARRLRGPGARLAAELGGCAVLYAASIGFRFAIEAFDWHPAGMYKTWLPARLDLFALGMALAAISAWLAATGRPSPRFLAGRAGPWVSWGLAALTFQVIAHGIGLGTAASRRTIDFTFAQDTGLEVLWGVFACFLLLPVVFPPERGQDPGAIRRFLSRPVMAWLGLVSYGIYLWHEAAIDLFLSWTGRTGLNQSFIRDSAIHWHYPFGLQANFVEMFGFMLLVSIPVAALSFYFVERPALRLKRRLPFLR